MVHVIEPNVSLSGEREEIEASVRTVNLVDELGQLSFIFSDNRYANPKYHGVSKVQY